MNVARILYPVQVLGPGNRVGIWLCGCSRGCKGCSNPELWVQRPEYEIEPEQVYMLVEKIAFKHKIDGFTVSGGEPMDQPKELARLLKLITPVSDDILIYTGYQIEELIARKDEWTDFILQNAAVLIDGPYIEELNDSSTIRGSSNQKIHIVSNVYRKRYTCYLLETHNQIQNFATSEGVVSVGIHRRGFTR